MNIKSVFIVVIMFSLMLGCSQTDTSIRDHKTKIEEELSFDEQYLVDVKESYEEDKESGSANVMSLITYDIEKIKDDSIKEEVKDILEETINRMTEEGFGFSELKRIFFPEGPEQIAYKEYLTDTTVEKIYTGVYPVYYELNKMDLTMVHEEFNEVIKVGESWDNTFSWLEDNEVKHEYLTNRESKIIVLSETGVIVYSNSFEIINVFKIEDKQGNNKDPHIVLEEVSQRIEEKERKESEEFYKEYNVEKRAVEKIKEQGPRIGMTDSEVVEIFGKPKKINKTTTAIGTREQWVYSDYKYLYFDDGILTTIQE